MEFWSSSESYGPASENVSRARNIIEPYINSRIRCSKLLEVECKIRYIPIVMPKEMHVKYTLRNRANIKSRTLDISSYLTFDIFVLDDLKTQLLEYCNGICEHLHLLDRFEFSESQISELEKIVREAPEAVADSG